MNMVLMTQDTMYAVAAGAVVEMTPLRSLIPMLPPVVHSALAGAMIKPAMDTLQNGMPFNFPDCFNTARLAYGAAGGLVANMYL